MAKIKRVSWSPSFSDLMVAAASMGETNDCTVKAVALICDVPYAAAHAALQQRGRQSRKGTYYDEYLAVIRSFGFEIREWTYSEKRELIQSYPGAHKNLRSITTHHPRRFRQAWAPHREKRLLFKCARHVAAFRNGELHDWTVNKAMRVLRIWEVTKVPTPEQMEKVTETVQSFWAHTTQK